MAHPPTHRDGQRLRKRYAKHRSHLFTFLDHPELPADNNGSERRWCTLRMEAKMIPVSNCYAMAC